MSEPVIASPQDARRRFSKPTTKRWLAATIAFAIFLLLAGAQHAQWRAIRVPLGEPYLGNCQAADAAYRCSAPQATLTAITLPIRLKARHDYTVTISGRSLTRDAVHVYVDFYGKDYDADAQKGELRLLPGAPQTFVFRWPSDLPPTQTWLRLSSADAGEYEISAATVTRASRPLTWLTRIAAIAALLLVLRALRHTDVAPRWHRVRTEFAVWRTRQPVGALALLMLGVGAALLLRAASLAAPVVFGDEMTYALLAQSLGNRSVYSHNGILLALPNQLYFDIYHFATLCGEATLSVARALNCVLFALAALPVFALARRVLPQRPALLLSALVLLMPNSVYTSFFMPESCYFLGFYICVWAFQRFLAPAGGMREAGLAGAALAALSLIKPHGLTILAACNLTLLIAACAWRGERRRVLAGWGVLLIAFVLARAVLGISDAPSAEGSWLQRTFGMYAGYITNTAHVSLDAQAMARLLLAAGNNVGSVLLLFGAPMLLSAAWLLRGVRRDAADTELARLQLFAFVALACLLIGTIKFTAYIAGSDPSQAPDRIHERYYDFVFGLLLLCGFASAQRLVRGVSVRTAWLWICALPVVAGAGWYAWQGLPALRPTWVDHATLLGVWNWQALGVFFVAALGVLAALLVPFAPRAAWRAYAVFLAFVVVGGCAAIVERSGQSRTLNDADRAALALKALYGPRELEHGLIVSSQDNVAPLFNVLFALRNNATVRFVPQGSALDPLALAPDAQWALLYGNYAITGSGWDEGLQLPEHARLYRRAHPSR